MRLPAAVGLTLALSILGQFALAQPAAPQMWTLRVRMLEVAEDGTARELARANGSFASTQDAAAWVGLGRLDERGRVDTCGSASAGAGAVGARAGRGVDRPAEDSPHLWWITLRGASLETGAVALEIAWTHSFVEGELAPREIAGDTRYLDARRGEPFVLDVFEIPRREARSCAPRKVLVELTLDPPEPSPAH
ncbi:MAG: hypothetical protein KBD01_08790 [Acidobacteria bacterium]|nr:hypothetical protein [Acidobacteriota bacterium]